MKILSFSIEKLGVENSQYFTGVSAIHTSFSDVVVGTGETAQEAYDSAVESLPDEIENLDILPDQLPDYNEKTDCVEYEFPDLDDEFVEMSYYVAIYYRTEN